MLKMTGAELAAYVEQQALENPALERKAPPERPSVSQSAHSDRSAMPDVRVEEIAGEYTISFINDYCGTLGVSQKYLGVLGNRAASGADMREAVKQNVRSAIDLLRNIEHRRQTIHRVVEYIIRAQRDYLAKGADFIKPESFEEAASKLGMGVWTVRQVVERKWLETPQGIVELQRFFKD